MATIITLFGDLLLNAQRRVGSGSADVKSNAKNLFAFMKSDARSMVQKGYAMYGKIFEKLGISTVVDFRKYVAEHVEELMQENPKLNIIAPEYKAKPEPKHSFNSYQLTAEDKALIETHSGDNANWTSEYIKMVDFTIYEEDIESNEWDPEHCGVIRNGNQNLPPVFMHLPEELHAKVAHYIVSNGQHKGWEKFMYEKGMNENLGQEINVTDARIIQYNNWVELGRPDRIVDNRQFNKSDAKNLLKNSGVFNRVVGESFNTADKRMINMLLEKYGHDDIVSYVKSIKSLNE